MKRLLTILFLLISVNVWGATYYVTATLQGDGSGSSYANSMGKAAHNAKASDFFKDGDIIYLCDTFAETYQIIPPSSGVTSDIIYDGSYPGHPCTFEFTNSETSPYYPTKSAIHITSKSHITVRNYSAPHCYTAVEIDGNSDHITVENVTAISTGGTNLAIGFYA